VEVEKPMDKQYQKNMKIETIAHDWCIVKDGNRKFEIGLHDCAVFPEEHRTEIEKIKKLTLNEFLRKYKTKASEIRHCQNPKCKKESYEFFRRMIKQNGKSIEAELCAECAFPLTSEEEVNV
jgi:hypothetical protein